MEITVGMPNLDLSENIAEITLNPKTQRIAKITLHQERLRFRCKRCATFCCKLGGPELTEKDVQRIEQAGYRVEEFLESVPNNKFKCLPIMRGNLKNKEDGSCIFLRFDAERGINECSIYDVRPTLCRLYPFDFERTGPSSFVLRLIPCCRGLNDLCEELVNEEFVTNYLLDAIFDLMIEHDVPF